MTAVLVALAGGLGAALRFAVDSWLVARTSTRLPWATFAVNVSGSFALGLLVGVSSDVTTVVGTGLLGGYTTFSAASLEAARRLLDGHRLDGVLTAVLMPLLCIAAAAGGIALGG